MATDDDTLVAPPNSAALLHDVDEPLGLLSHAARYEDGVPLGEGGMGDVTLVRDRQIGRDVALKTIRAEMAVRSDLRARFLREARVQGQLEHPAIVPVYDLGEDDAKRAFFTMKRVQGETLEAILERLRTGDEETTQTHTRHKLLAAFVRVCLAIDYAHSRGVIHRDLKPSNVMLGRFGEVYILDWGVAKIRELDAAEASSPAVVVGDASSSPKLTSAGAVIGTPAYMAPEQIEGTTIDPRTDVYALGGILFEMLTLESLPGGSSSAAMMTDVLHGVDARASVRAPHRDVPPELEAICVRASARRPSMRHGSARDLADAVEAYLNGDRDLELRRQIARRHLVAANEAAALARRGSDLELRRAALREVGRAVALAPDEPEGLSLLFELLSEPPKELPLEVRRSVDAEAAEAQRAMLPKAALATGVVGAALLPVVLVLASGARYIAVVPGAWLLCALVAWLAFRFDTAYRSRPPYVSVFLAIAAAATTLLYGPLLVAPTICVGVAAAYTATLSRRYRYVLVAVMTAAFVVPGMLALVGLHPVSESFTGDALVIHAGVHVSRVSTYLLVTGLQIAAMAFSVRFVARYRDALTASEAQNQLIAWQLGQLVPAPLEAVRSRARR